MIILIFVQVVAGIVGKGAAMMEKSHPYLIHSVKHVHKILGYAMVLGGKIQSYLQIGNSSELDKLYWSLMVT